MAVNVWPFVSQATTDLQYSKLFRNLQKTGVVGVVGDNALKGSANSTGMNTYIAAGDAIVRGFYFENTSSLTVAHDAASTQPRIDRVVLRLDLTQGLSSRVRAFVIKGTAAASPAIPALTRVTDGVWDLPLYRAAIDANATSIAAAKITDEREFIGTQVASWTESRRPNPAKKYEMGFNETSGHLEYYDGSQWRNIWYGLSWDDIVDIPETSTLDGRTIYDGDAAPSNSLGQNNDIYLEW